MTAILRAVSWAAVALFLFDLLLRCFVVQAWTVAPCAIAALGLSIWRMAVAIGDYFARRRDAAALNRFLARGDDA